MNKNQLHRYLKLLDVSESKPSIHSLTNIISAHLSKIPFENISKLYRFKNDNQKDIPNIDQFLDGMENYHFGGTCYTNNYFLNQLLTYLGYEVKLCGADMNRPDVHLVSIVKVEGREFIVDVGYAAPFLEPLPIDLHKDFSMLYGEDEYVIKPQDQEGKSRLEMYRNGNLRHGYIVKPEPRQIEEFSPIISDSYRPSATFMNAVLLVRFDIRNSYVIHNKQFIVTHNGSSSTKELRSTGELVDTIYDVFRIPKNVTNMALEGFSFEGDAWG